jgi:hypothetical protein
MFTSPAETPVWQEFGPEQPEKVKCQSDEERDYISETAEVFEQY